MLSKEELQAIKEDAERFAEKAAFRVPYDGSNNFYDEKHLTWATEAYIAGATVERERSKELVRELQRFVDGYDHDEDAHRYNNLPACRVCSAEKAITNYNQHK